MRGSSGPVAWRQRPSGAPPARSRSSWGGATDAVFSGGPEPGLEGKRVPQIPRYQVGGGARVTLQRGTDATVEVRHFGDRYEDDLNLFPLGRTTVVDALLAQRVGRGFQLFVAVENLLNETYLVGRTPLPTIGTPRAMRAGLRWMLP